MQQLVLGIVLLVGGVVLNAVCARLRPGAGAPQEAIDVREASSRVRAGQAAACTVRARLCADKPACPPFGSSPAAYYETKVVAQEEGRAHTVFSETSAAQPYLQDSSGGEKLWVDMRAFGKGAELMPSRMDSALPGSPLYAQVEKRVSYEPGPSFSGYRVLEGYLPNGGPVTVCGAVSRENGRLVVGPGRRGAQLTYRVPQSGGQAQQRPALRARIPLLAGAAAMVAGAVLVLVYFL